MTRKAIRKKRQQEEKRQLAQRRQQLQRPSVRLHSSSSWVTVGALVASAAIGIRPAAASPLAQSSSPSQLSQHVRGAFDRSSEFDPRLALVAAAFRAQQDPAGARAVRRFDIPPGPIGDAIVAFQRLTGVAVTLEMESIGLIQSPGATGAFTVEEALNALLSGTGVRFRLTSPNAAVFELNPVTESVDVTGQATVVASPKYAGPLRNIPQTIEIIPRAAMEQQGVTTLSEALRNVPGITLQAGEGGGASSTAGDMFNMRGFNAANSLFVDGVRDDGLISRDVFNLEQVEVFMGPTGSDVGRGTASGYINMQTKTPRLPASSAGSVAFGSASQLRTTVDINQPLSLRQDGGWLTKSAIRINGLWQDSGVPGRNEVELGTKAIAPSLALGVDTATRVTFSGQIVRQDNVPDYGVPGAAWEEPLAPAAPLAAQPVNQENYYGSPAYDYDRARQDSVVARLEHDVQPGMTFRNQTRYNAAKREAIISTIQNVAAFNPATNLVTVARQGNERENNILSNQTSLTDRFATGRLQHSASAGLEYTHERQLAPTLTGFGVRAPVNIFNPNPNDPVTNYAVAKTGANSVGSTDTIALYGFDTIDVTPRVQLSGGFRWEYYDTQFRANDAAGAITTDLDAADGIFSGKAALLVKVNQRGNVYLAYGSTVTPPGSANFTLSAQANNANNPNVKPQKSSNIEVGSKWDLVNNRLSLSGSAFHTVNKNVIFTVDANAIPPVFNYEDGQEVNGVTVGAAGQVLPGWQVLANFSYLDTALDSQNPANNGRRLTLTPVFSGSFWTSYQFPRRVTVGGGLRTTGDVFINAPNTIRSPGYHLVDALAEYEVNQHLSLRLNIYNLTDERYVRSVNNNGGRYNPGNPRSVLATTMVRF